MGQMLIWASQVGWINIDRSMVYDHGESLGFDRDQSGRMCAHMDWIFSRLHDEATAAMAGVIYADSGFEGSPTPDSRDWDDWS